MFVVNLLRKLVDLAPPQTFFLVGRKHDLQIPNINTQLFVLPSVAAVFLEVTYR